MRDAGGAHQCAELHERLIVRPGGASRAREDRLGDLPEMPLSGGALRLDSRRKDSSENAGDIRVDERRPALIRERRDRACGVRADSWQRTKICRIRWKRTIRPIAAFGHLSCQTVKIPSPSVVAEALPRFHDVRRFGSGDVRKSGEALEELTVARHDAGDLRLLKHQLGNEDLVSDARPAPRQIAAVRAEPRSKTPAERVSNRWIYRA